MRRPGRVPSHAGRGRGSADVSSLRMSVATIRHWLAHCSLDSWALAALAGEQSAHCSPDTQVMENCLRSRGPAALLQHSLPYASHASKPPPQRCLGAARRSMLAPSSYVRACSTALDPFKRSARVYNLCRRVRTRTARLAVAHAVRSAFLAVVSIPSGAPSLSGLCCMSAIGKIR